MKKTQVAGQQEELIEISIHEYEKYMDMGEYGNMGKIQRNHIDLFI